MEFGPDSLITFLHLADGHSFATTARHLGLRPSTVSGHVAALERTVGEPLIVRRRGPGGEVTVTPAGRELIVLARPLVEAHRRAEERFARSDMSGLVRLAIADDIAAHPGVGDAVRTFRTRHPGASVEVTVGQSGHLHRRLRAGQFDLALVKRLPVGDGAAVIRREAICWTVHVDARDRPADPLPLTAYPTSSFLRNHAVARLNSAGIAWRIANTVRGVNGAYTAVRAGLGIGVFAERMLPSDLCSAPPGWALPELGDIETVIARSPDPSAATRALSESLEAWGVDLLPPG